MGVDGMNFKLRIIEISRDVGGRKGTVYELHGHRNKVTCMTYLATSKRLMSCGEDGNLILWNMAVEREEVNGARSFRCALRFPLTTFTLHFKYIFVFRRLIGISVTTVNFATVLFSGISKPCTTKSRSV